MSNYLRDLSLDNLESAEKIIIGLSGGADSVALTHILFMRFGGEKLLCAHLNHGIRGEEAERDENFAENFAESLGIRFVCKSVNIPLLCKEKGMGSEECGRAERYAFFYSLAGEKDLIATAHNADDNAETMLMNLSRGTGLSGLTGIPQNRDRIVRPILSLTRAQIEDYCRENKLSYVTDSTNLGDEYNRNIIRHRVIPALCNVNSAAVRNMFRTAEILNEDREYLDSLGKKLLASAKRADENLSAALLLSSDPPVMKRAVMAFLEENGVNHPERKHIEKFIRAAKTGGSLNVPGGFFVNVKQGIITITKEDIVFKDAPLVLGRNPLPGGKTLIITEKKYTEGQKINNLLFNSSFDYAKITSIPSFGPRRSGEKLRIAGRGITKSLKTLFNEKRIPTSLRDSYPVIRLGNEIVCIPGVAVAEKFRITDKTDKFYFAEII